MTSPTRERKPTRVWVSLHPDGPSEGYRYIVNCRACGYLPRSRYRPDYLRYSRWGAIKQAQRHATECPALRLACLEAELENERNDHLAQASMCRITATLPEHDSSYWTGVADQHELSADHLTDILARHRQASA